jgi:hypothetical protein
MTINYLLKIRLNPAKQTFQDVYESNCKPKEYHNEEYWQAINATAFENVSVFNSVFINISSNICGGALYCNGSVYRLLIERSSFISCMTSDCLGGGIYLYSAESGGCVLNKVCAYSCSSMNSGNSFGQFAWVETKYMNHVNDSSITHTLQESGDSWCALRLFYGNILCPSVNLTNNICKCCPALYCHSTTENTCSMSYSSIVNNTANRGCIRLTNSDLKCIDTCNILNNSQNTPYEATIYVWGNLLIKDSCIIGNKNNNVFWVSSSNNITISNCTIDDDIFANTRYHGSVTINKYIESSFFNQLSYIVTQRCDPYFETVPIPTKTPRCLMSCICNCNYRGFVYDKLNPAFNIF